MAENYGLSAVCIKKLEDIRAAEDKHRGREIREIICLKDKDQSWMGRWKAKFDYVKPGITNDRVYAIEGTAYLNGFPGSTNETFIKETFRLISQWFGGKNILSFCSWQETESLNCHFLIFPLHGRQLMPDPWIDSRSKTLKREHLKEFYDVLSKMGIDTSNEAPEDNGHTRYLDEFPLVNTSKEDTEELFYNTISKDDQVHTDCPIDEIRRISNETIKSFTVGVDKGTFIKFSNNDITLNQYLAEVYAYLTRVYPQLSESDKELIQRKVRSVASGFYVLDDLIDDSRISDIKTMSPYKIRVKVEGNRKTSNLHFLDAADYKRFLDGLIVRYGLDPDKQIHVFTDTESNENYILRCDLTLEEINAGFPIMHIRKFPKNKYTIEQLIEFGMMDPVVANYMIWAARYAKGIVFTGKGSAGKSTIMNSLLEYTPSNASGLVIQESNELYSDKPEMVFEQITEEYDLKALAKNGLLTDIDYFIIGEVKGEEAMYFINACDTGNKAWCSVHSPSSTEAINKLADYVMYASKYSHQEALYMLKELQVIVFMKNFKVAEISEVIGWDEERNNLKYRTVFRRKDLVEQNIQDS